MFKPWIIRQLRRRGWKISRVPPDTYGTNPHYRARETQEIHKLIRHHFDSPGDGSPTWDAVCSYLSPGRMCLYHEVIDVFQRHDVDLSDRRVLDVGVHSGVLLRLLGQRVPAASLWGIDCSEFFVKIARTLCPRADIQFGSLEACPFADTFDAVILTEVLEHLIDPEDGLRRMNRMAAEDGVLLITVPNGRFDTTAPSTYFPERQSFKGHVNFWSPESWEFFLKRAFPSYAVELGQLPTGQLYALVRKQPTASTKGRHTP